MKALLIIDMQKTLFTPATPRFDAENVIRRINELSDKFRINGDKVIFIQHDGTKEDYCIPGTEEWEILPSLVIKSSDIIISKTANDAFYRTALQDVLSKSGIDELVITGCATDFCVDSTIKSALTNDFNITVIKDGHTTGDRPHLKADKIIEHYNWIWREMIPTSGKIRVINSSDFIDTAF
jgi:nicotinamidase-related amidase